MAERFDPLDPLGILKPIREDIDKVVGDIGLPPIPGPPGLARRTEAERAARHGGSPPERGTALRRLFDPLGLFEARK